MMMVANDGPRRKEMVNIASAFWDGDFGPVASTASGAQRKTKLKETHSIRTYPDARGTSVGKADKKGAELAWWCLNVARVETFHSAGHCTDTVPRGQDFFVNGTRSHLKPTPGTGDPPANGSNHWYPKQATGNWANLSNCDLAFFGACYSAVPEAIAPVAAKECGARHAVGFNPGGLCGDLVYDFHECFWAKWGEGKSVEEALA